MFENFLSYPFFEERHRVLAEDLSKWAEDFFADYEPEEETTKQVDEACGYILKALAKEGLLKATVPSAFGGLNEKLDVRTLCIGRMILASHSGLADFVFAMQGLGSGAISLFGSKDQKEAYLPFVARGEKIAAFALTEEKAGSDVAAIATTAEKTKDGFVLNGDKTFISNGGIADFYVVFARTGEGDGAKGLSAFIIDKDTKGLVIDKRINVIAPHPLASLRFENMHVPQSSLLRACGNGFKIAMSTLDVFRTTVGAAALGFSNQAIDVVLKRVKSRQLFGKPLAESSITQMHLADMALERDAASLLIARAAWLKDTSDQRHSSEVAMAKLHATEAAQKCADAAVQLFGGLGVTKGQVPEALYREVRALRIYEGASDVQKLIIARSLLSS